MVERICWPKVIVFDFSRLPLLKGQDPGNEESSGKVRADVMAKSREYTLSDTPAGDVDRSARECDG